ncbi:MAG: response regulator [Methanoregula sp.]|uniref:response regulator n=1 Tax=Methanoregula sp. TaxID=2052170 RepID=UPI0025D20774|nr:response regulator [Methanoregula sp.]MCK9632084.1 response regulator [Methanoregula sp.]
MKTVWICCLALCLGVLVCSCGVSAAEQPVPEFDKILQIKLTYDDGRYSVSSMEVRYGKAPNLKIRTGDLAGKILGPGGNELQSFSVQEPGRAYGDILGDPGGDSLIGYTEQPAYSDMFITAPYEQDMEQFTLTDMRDGTLLVTADLRPSVNVFCADYAGDPDCLVRAAPVKTATPDTSLYLVLATLFSASVFIAAGLAILTIRRRTKVLVPEKQDVLIVDDDPDMVEAIAELLRMEGYAPRTASSGRECLDLIKKQIPDLILLDVGMSPMDGWQTLGQIKKGPASRTIPVLMLTGRQLTPELAKQYHICIDDYLMKPFQLDELYAAINSILERKKQLEVTLALARKAGVDKDKFCELAKLSRRITVDKKLLGILNVPMAVPVVADLDLDTLDDMLVVDYINVKTRDRERRAEQLRQEINSVFRSKGFPELGW